jgi:uncharacterized protein (TIGR00369 family)
MAASGASQSMSTSVFIPAFAGYETRVRDSFARQGAMRLIGATVGEVAPGYCAIELVPRPELSQQHGYVHAGIVSAIVDTAGGYAGFTLFAQDCSVLTVEFKLNLLAPAAGDRLLAEGFVVKPGRSLAITRGEVHAEKDGKRTLIAIMQQTLMVMHGKADA